MTQKEIIKKRLEEVGYVDNYWSIENKVSSRLGAIIHILKKEGYEFTHYWVGKNYHYKLINRPVNKITPKPDTKPEPQVSMFGNYTPPKKAY